MDFQIKRFNWLRSPSAWQATQAWRARQQTVRGDFEAANSAASSTFAGASANQVAGMGEISARIASKRIQQERLAKSLNTLA